MLAPKSAGFLARIPGAHAVGRRVRLVGRAIAFVWRIVTFPFPLAAVAGPPGQGRRRLERSWAPCWPGR